MVTTRSSSSPGRRRRRLGRPAAARASRRSRSTQPPRPARRSGTARRPGSSDSAALRPFRSAYDVEGGGQAGAGEQRRDRCLASARGAPRARTSHARRTTRPWPRRRVPVPSARSVRRRVHRRQHLARERRLEPATFGVGRVDQPSPRRVQARGCARRAARPGPRARPGAGRCGRRLRPGRRCPRACGPRTARTSRPAGNVELDRPQRAVLVRDRDDPPEGVVRLNGAGRATPRPGRRPRPPRAGRRPAPRPPPARRPLRSPGARRPGRGFGRSAG